MLAIRETEMTPLIKLNDVKMHFTQRKGLHTTTIRAVDGVSFSIDKGETVAVVGESGSGKTTLGRITLRILPPTSGQLVFDGNEITKTKERDLDWFRRVAGMIFQDPYASINPRMQVEQIISEPLVIHKMNKKTRRDKVFQRLEEVKLTPPDVFASKYPYTLSGGQRQKVAIARAMILDLKYIVADEPVSMIDVSNRAEILCLLKEIQTRHGITVLYITHDIATARYFADRIAVMYLGKIVEMGNSGEIISEPLHPYTQALLEAVPEPNPNNLLRERKEIKGEPPRPDNIPQGCRFHPRCFASKRGQCDRMEPQMIEAKPSHHVACFL